MTGRWQSHCEAGMTLCAWGAGLLLMLTAGCQSDSGSGAGDNVTGPPPVVLSEIVINPDGVVVEPSPDGTVTDAGELQNTLVGSPAALSFGTSAVKLPLFVSATGEEPLTYTVSSPTPWIQTGGAASASLNTINKHMVSIDRSQLPGGTHTGIIELTTESHVKSVLVVATVGGGSGLSLVQSGLIAWPGELNFGLDQNILSLNFTKNFEQPLTYTVTSNQPWLFVEPANGSLDTETDILLVLINRSFLPVGLQQGAITISTDAGPSITVPVFAEGWPPPSNSVYITGRVLRPDGTPVAGATLRATNGGALAFSGADGRYSLAVPHGWAGSINADHMQFAVNPHNKVLSKRTGDTSNVDFIAEDLITEVPSFLCAWADGEGVMKSGVWEYDGPRVKASVQYVGLRQWELTITNKHTSLLKELWWPWEPNQYYLNANTSDDVFFEPMYAGVAIVADKMLEWGWNGWPYPGLSFCGMTILTDQYRARAVASTNWPPVTVYPFYSLRRQAMYYPSLDVPPGQTRKLRCLIVETDGEKGIGQLPWQLAADYYSDWLHARQKDDGFYPYAAADWFLNTHGMLQIDLHNLHEFKPDVLRERLHRFKDVLRYAQCWGQMSNYAGDPAVAVPPLAPGEEVGCCLREDFMHPRYLPDLQAIAGETKAQGMGFGYYARPIDINWEYFPLLDDPTPVNGKTPLNFFLDWISRNRDQYGGNAHYIDVFGRIYFGDPGLLMPILLSALPRETVVEGTIDCYPFGGLWGGYFIGDPFGGGPNQPLENLGQGYWRASTPRYGRYILGDRPVFAGFSNEDNKLMGPANAFWLERQVFLMGLQFELANPDAGAEVPGGLNKAVDRTVTERDRVNWYPRRPFYKDRQGITNMTPGIDVRAFIDKDGVVLFAIDNWGLLPNASFEYNGHLINVPAGKELAIVHWTPQTGQYD